MDERHVIACREEVRHNYTEEEKRELGRELAEKIQEFHGKEDEKKRVTTRFASDLQDLTTAINALSLKITSGYSSETCDCEWHYHDPVQGMKTLYLAGTRKEVRSVAMTMDERQEKLFDPPPGDDSGKKKKGKVN